jgi:type IVB pilus formation R64 PilN family outer membrane protein
MKQIRRTAAALAVVSVLAGCAVSNSDVKQRAEEMRVRITEQAAAQDNKPAAPLVERVRGTYLGAASIPLAYDATLPAVFNDVTLAFPGRSNLATVGERITEVTKIPVRLQPDVLISAKSLVRAGLSQSAAASTAMPMGPLPSPLTPRLPGATPNGGGIATQTFDDFDAKLPMDYTGTLSGYLDLICARLGINWEYKDGTIFLYRMVTKVLTVKVSPGSLEYASGLKEGGDDEKGSFASTSTSSTKGDYSVWTTMEASIKGMLSPLGSATVDQAGGLVVVTDTKEAVETVAKYVNIQNASLTRQVSIAARVVRVVVTDSSEMGFDANLIYKKLSAGAVDWSLGMTAPTTVTSTEAGVLEMNVLKPNSRFEGSTAFVQALSKLGTIVSDETTTVNTTNRRPVPVAKFQTTTYLKETKPATGGGATGGGAGVPGLTPGTVTTGFFLNILPTAFENNSVLMQVSLSQSDLTGIGKQTTGSGETLQMIQTPEKSGTKTESSIGLRDGESIVLMGVTRDGSNAERRSAVSGYSETGKRVREVQIVVLTPKVRSGI